MKKMKKKCLTNINKMSEETILSTIRKRYFSLSLFIFMSTILFFSVLSMMNTYVKDNNRKLKKIEHFIESEKQIQENGKTVGLKSFKKMNSMFDKKRFSLGCCPSPYSTDKGCLCMDSDTKNTMDTRGRNTTPIKETRCY